MQIKTAFAIGTGITVGVLIGMRVSDDTKCKIFGKIRKKLIYALGGEEKKNYTTFRNPTYHTTYKNYASVSKEKDQGKKRVDIPDQELLKFDDYKSAVECLAMMKYRTANSGVVSVHDLARFRGKSLDYTWDAYGWRECDLIDIDVPSMVEEKYVLNLPRPTYLKE